jgi:hypothetical protein
MYMLSGTVNPSTTGATITTTTSMATSTSSTSPPTTTGLPSGWKYGGCYNEGQNGRAITNQQNLASNTIENCVTSCIAAGYTVAGLEFSSQCFCDTSLHNGATPASDSQCNMACQGNSQETCGAGNILSVYHTGNLTVYQSPTTQTTNLPGSWTYQGCYTESQTGTRALKWQVILANNNSATSCLSLCSSFGYMAGGMEYGRECYCGDDPARIATGSVKTTESDCSITCTGDPTHICGGGARLSYYTWTGIPLYIWHKPIGPSMGSYEFLVGGVVVPLITTVGINNKIVFLEKSGTGPPNTTGTYELDLAFIKEFSKAWRPLHLKTDVFCSAGITLPDKVGRQLNIGGWSGASTYGVRFYWPDGSPGVLGVNDWQENVEEVSLLAGRWYPSAMILTNGSIMVIGGETGSNASPTPSIEILPPPVDGYEKYLDWLDRTDPYNLYPFLFVLPTGGILCLYYNEARILDENTFDTTRTLPNMPGTVISFLSGRTYPLEGTAVTLPLSPPYSAPITVLVCGGSTAGAGEAIDNCISIQPELADPVWVIERMPSARVLSCMTALPDGTYLILNGALQGVGGFGLATGPNLVALLYDPALPAGQRISIMNTTIVARLYHSEAVLLPDGRVLVSGSDPEDGVNPQEYRVEVFNPPYTLSGLAAPSFTINNRDWAYDDKSISIAAKIPSGNLDGVRASMLAAVSSTHGNSMGQRTIFLSISCMGPAAAVNCTVKAPPTPHVAPPGWYQVFILDGSMPSYNNWIRIGGSIADAAGLGNWPPYADFNTPGLGPVGS